MDEEIDNKTEFNNNNNNNHSNKNKYHKYDDIITVTATTDDGTINYKKNNKQKQQQQSQSQQQQQLQQQTSQTHEQSPRNEMSDTSINNDDTLNERGHDGLSEDEIVEFPLPFPNPTLEFNIHKDNEFKISKIENYNQNDTNNTNHKNNNNSINKNYSNDSLNHINKRYFLRNSEPCVSFNTLNSHSNSDENNNRHGILNSQKKGHVITRTTGTVVTSNTQPSSPHTPQMNTFANHYTQLNSKELTFINYNSLQSQDDIDIVTKSLVCLYLICFALLCFVLFVCFVL